jgi:hypothetical protein
MDEFGTGGLSASAHLLPEAHGLFAHVPRDDGPGRGDDEGFRRGTERTGGDNAGEETGRAERERPFGPREEAVSDPEEPDEADERGGTAGEQGGDGERAEE